MAPYFRHTSGSSKIHWSEWDDLCLKNLFEPEQASIDHLPIREQLKYYKKRDLLKTKFYNIRLKCWGLKAPNLVRDRILETDGGGKTSIAFPGNQNSNRKFSSNMDEDFYEDGVKEFKDPKSSVCYQKFKQKLETSPRLEKKVGATANKMSDSKVSQYKAWVEQRMALKSDFDEMLNFEKMSFQPQLNPLQVLVAQRFLEWKYPSKEFETPAEEKSKSDSLRRIRSPRIDRPLPDLYKNLEEYINLNGIRWFDLFNQIDREKSWELTTDKILSLLKSLGAHVTKGDADDFLNFFDPLGTGKVTYKDLITKRSACKVEERRSKAGTRIEVMNSTDEKVDHFNNNSLKNSTASGIQLKKYMMSPTLDSLAGLIDNSSDRNVAVFAMYENDPRLYKQELIRSSRLNSKRTSRASTMTSKDYLLLPEKTNMTEKNEKESFGSRKSSISTPRYRKLPSRLQPIGKETPLSEGPYIRSSMTNKTETPLDADFIEPKTETLVSKRPSTKSRIKIDKQFREQTFTSLKPEKSESSEFLKFRKKCWQDYIKVKKLFADKGLVMSVEALERALLFPREKTKAQLKRSVAVPREADIQLKLQKPGKQSENSANFSEESSTSLNGSVKFEESDGLNSRPSLTSGATTNKDIRASDLSSSDYRIRPPAKNQHFDPRFQYPKNKRPATHGTFDNLSTGPALIKPKTDCWMTFDEYVTFCGKTAPKFHKIGPVNHEAFWPGCMLDKLALPFTGRERSVDNLFTHVKQSQTF